jgi:hypothetical protein
MLVPADHDLLMPTVLDPVPQLLFDTVAATLPTWLRRVVADRATGWFGRLDEETAARLAPLVDDAVERARVAVLDELAVFLALDVDEQRTNPLAVLRRAVRFPTEVLAELGVPHVVRDEFAERAFPDDVYGLGPATWGDIHPDLHEPGLLWGAWKAKTVFERRRAEGRLAP